MKLIPVVYHGFTAMDRRFSSPMLPWIVSEIRKRAYSEKISLGVEEGVLQAYNQDFELQFAHKVQQMTRFSQADLDPCTFLYLLREDNENLLYCYLFQAKKMSDVTDLYKQMKEQNHPTPTRSISSAANLTSLCVDISPSSSNFFEVLYIGKIKVAHKKLSDTFIDDALEKFRLHELDKNKLRQLGIIGRLKSEGDILRKGSTDSSASETSCEDNSTKQSIPQLQRSQSYHSNLLLRNARLHEDLRESRLEEETTTDDAPTEELKEACQDTPSDLKSVVNMEDHNRTMVLQVDRTDLRLISPDRKVILLHKQHRDVTTCVQGQIHADHFGFICREGNNGPSFTGFIFKCESPSVASDTCAAITQAFVNSEIRPRTAITSCEHCPMVWFHKLCVEIEQLSDRKTQAAIFRRLEQLDEDEQNVILTKFRGAETDSVREQNEFLMMLLRAHCEMKQGRHVHDTAENRSEFLNQYLGGSTIFTKARRSLSNSFDQLLKRKGSRDDFGGSLRGLNLPISNNLNRESSPHSTSLTALHDTSDKDSEGSRSRSSTIGSQSDLNHLQIGDSSSHKGSVSPDRNLGCEKGLKSPMMDIFFKVGNSPKSSSSDDNSPNKIDAGSWRQAIFKNVVTPGKAERVMEPTRAKTKEELRSLWKKAIHQAIWLVRMEKENARIKAKQEESAVKRIKLEYDEMKPNQREVMEVWEMLTSKESGRMKCDNQMLLHAIRQGVPRGKRGEVWHFLAEQFCAKVPPIDTSKFPNYNVPYETLLKQLTSHQHAILIDLGRTFPNHSYFSSPLGPGQLALFNLLKAYSLLDPEVGYCQGLSFVAGVLLLHMEESQAFSLLRHLMFRREMRYQYLPDMVSLQIKLYQLSRLIHDQLPDLYDHFNHYEVAPTLYATPWLLTVFASQFPLGFVTRVFDLTFLEGPDVIFRVALALLMYHKEKLLHCEHFEEIMNYLKIQLPIIDKPMLDKMMKTVYTTDIKTQLNEYKVEYQVLQEMSSVQPQVEALHKCEAQIKILINQNKTLTSQLEMAVSNVQRLEKIRVFQQSQLNRLEMQSRASDVTIATLGNFIQGLVDEKKDLEISDDVRRILSQISFTERRRSEFRPQQNNLLKMFQKPEMHNDKVMVKSLSTGKIDVSGNLDQNEFRTNSLKSQVPIIPNLSHQTTKFASNSSEKTSKFFSSSHNTILQQKLNAQTSLPHNAKIDIKIQELENPENIKISPTDSIDSGVSTPVSPKVNDPHPLSNCDVSFTYNGTRELKHVKNTKNMMRNCNNQNIISNK